MNKKFGLSFLLTVLVQAFIYDQQSIRSSWSGTFFILSIFTLIYIFLSYLSAKSREPSTDGISREGKVVDLDQFRKRKEAQNRPEEQEQPELKQWAPLLVSNDPSKMELVHSLLTSYNIECHISNRHVTSLYPPIEGLDMILQVYTKDQQRCLEILKEHDLRPEEG